MQQSEVCDSSEGALKSFDSFLWTAVLLLMVFLTRYHNLFYPAFNWDEPAMMSESWAMTQGQILYRDIPQIHPLFQFLIFFPFFKALPTHFAPIAIRVLNMLLVIFGAVLMRRLVRSVYHDALVSNLAAVLFILYLGFPWARSSHGNFYIVFPLLATSYFILPGKRFTVSRATFVGFLWGVAFFIEQVALLDIGTLLVAIFLLKEELSISKSKIYFSCLLGFGLAIAVACLYPLFHGTVSLTARATLFQNAVLYLGTGIPNKLAPSLLLNFFVRYAERLGAFVKEMAEAKSVLYGLLPILIVGICLVPMRTPKSSKRDWLRTLFISFIWISCIFSGLSLSEHFYPHYLIQLVTPLILFYCAWLSILKPKVRKTLALLAIVCCFVGAVGVFMNDYSDEARQEQAIVRSDQIATYIRQATDTEDTIFLIEECYLDIFYLSERLSPNGIYMYLDMDPDHMHDQGKAKELQEKFLRKLPTVILRGPCPDYPAGEFFDEVIGNRYTLTNEIAGAKIYRLR